MRRERLARAAEARTQQQQQRGAPNAGAGRAGNRGQPDAQAPGGRAGGGSGSKATGGAAGGAVGGGDRNYGSAREAAATAALQRATSGDGGISAEKRAELAERRRKDDLIGRIEHYCRLTGDDVPIGLPAASVDALEKHLQRAKGRAESRQREQAAIGAVTR